MLAAVPAAIAIARYEFRGWEFLNALFLSPLIIPHLMLGVAMLRLFAPAGTTGSFGWLVASHVVIVTPYVMRLLIAAISGFDRSVPSTLRMVADGTFLAPGMCPERRPGRGSGSVPSKRGFGRASTICMLPLAT